MIKSQLLELFSCLTTVTEKYVNDDDYIVYWKKRFSLFSFVQVLHCRQKSLPKQPALFGGISSLTSAWCVRALNLLMRAIKQHIENIL